MAASYSEMTAKGADGLLVEEGSGFGSKPDKYYGRSPAGVAIVALCLLLCLGVVALVTYCTVQSLRNEEHVRHLEREMERLKHQVVSQYGSRSVDRGYERNSDPYDYRVYGDDTDDGYGGNDDWYGVYDRRFQDQDSSGDHPDDLIDRDDFSFDGDQGAAASRTKRSVIRKNKKEHRTERPRKGNRKGSRKGRNKLNKDNLNKYIEDRIKEATNMATIHLYGALTHNSHVMEKLRRSPQEYVNYPDLDGRLYQQGFVANKETMAFWEQAPWSVNKQANAIYSFNKTAGSITVKKDGIYFIYAQAYFRSAVDNLSFQIRVNNITQFTCKAAGHIGSDVIEEQSFVRHVPTWGCSTGGLTQVSRGDRIILWNRYIYPILMEPSATYWGIIGINTS